MNGKSQNADAHPWADDIRLVKMPQRLQPAFPKELSKCKETGGGEAYIVLHRRTLKCGSHGVGHPLTADEANEEI